MRRFFCALIMTGCLAGCGNSTLSQMAMPDDEISQFSQSGRQPAIALMLKHYQQKKQVTGMIVAVIRHDGPAEFYAWGVTDARQGNPVTPQTLFALGSLSKGVTAEVIASLVNEGRLHWDDTLVTLLPPGTPLSSDAQKITLLQLVTHTSGLPRQPMDLLTMENVARYFANGENFYQELDNDSVLSWLGSFSAPKARQPQYSNIGYAILGYILKYKTHTSVEALATHYIFQPLQLKNTSFNAPMLRGYPQRALGHAGDQPKFIPRGQLAPDWVFNNNMIAAASLYSNAGDLIEYARAHFTPTADRRLNKTLNDVTVSYFERPREAANLAWVSDSAGDSKITYQVGYIGGYSSYIGFDKKNKNAVVVLQNSFNWSNYIGQTILTRLR